MPGGISLSHSLPSRSEPQEKHTPPWRPQLETSPASPCSCRSWLSKFHRASTSGVVVVVVVRALASLRQSQHLHPHPLPLLRLPSLFDGAAMLALAGMDALFVAAAAIHRHRTHHAAGAGGGNWRVSELAAFFVLCMQVGVLQFVRQPASARALSIGAAHALPYVASVTFFLGIALIYALVGNAGGAAGGAVAGNGPAPAPAAIRLLADMTLWAALACCLMSIIVALFYSNTKSSPIYCRRR